MKSMTLKGTAIAVVAAVLAPVTAAAQEACSSYTVKEGDSLAAIAQVAYGSFDYQMIFNANRNLINNPNIIASGTVLQLPCEDGSVAGAASAKEIIQQQEAAQAARANTSNAYEPAIRIVSGNGWAPYTGESLGGGGMLVRLATTSLNRGGNSREYNVSFVDDWASHLDTLLPMGLMDISIAWIRPENCENPAELDYNSRYRCEQLDWTVPIYETVQSYWTRRDNEYANVRDFSDYAGAVICRPEGWAVADLTAEGLVEPLITMMQPPTAKECVEAIIDGSADLAPLDIETGSTVVRGIEGAEKVVLPNPNLSKLQTLHFVTHKTNPRGRVYVAMLNRGLNEMRESGEWYAVISDSLSEFNKLSN